MKWIFVILVSLNLIVFASTIIHKMNARGQSAKEQVHMVQDGSGAPGRKGGSDYLDVVSLKEDMDKEDRAREAEERADRERRAREARDRARDKSKGEAGRHDTAATSIYLDKPRRGGCNTATIRLKDNTYHRIKLLLNRWPHAASRQVVRNGEGGSRTMFHVVVPGSPNDAALMEKLRSVKLNPQIKDGQIVLGSFSNRRAASNVQATVSGQGVRTSIQEKTEGLGDDQPLSQVVYKVVFNNVNDDMARQIESIVKPYGELQRVVCNER